MNSKKISTLIAFWLIAIVANSQTVSIGSATSYGTSYDVVITLSSPTALNTWELKIEQLNGVVNGISYIQIAGATVIGTPYVTISGNQITINNTGLSYGAISAGGSVVVNCRILSAEASPTVDWIHFPDAGTTNGGGGNSGARLLAQNEMWENGGIHDHVQTTNYVKTLNINAFTKITGSSTLGSDALQLRHPTPLSNGRIHYTFFANRTFSSGVMFSAIGGYEASPASTAQNLSEGPRTLILQPQELGGNVGIGYHTIEPAAKLSIIANNYTPSGLIVRSSLGLDGGNSTYGIASIVSGSTSNGNQYGIFSSVPGNLSNVWAAYFKGKTQIEGEAYFQGKTEVNGNFLLGNNNNTFIFHSGLNDNSLFIAPKLSQDNYDWGVQIEFKGTGELIKRIDSDTKKAFSIQRNNGTDVFRVMGNGNVFATRVKVMLESDFPDYVFQPNYNLIDLYSLEKFILLNNRLPSMPAADEVKEEGIDLGELTRLQQEKIEELTIHTINQQRMIDELIKRIEKLEAIK